VEAPPLPPGHAAREVLNALSYAPTEDTYSTTSGRPTDASGDSGGGDGQSFISRKISRSGQKPPLLPVYQPESPRLQSKSRSLVSLLGSASPLLSSAHRCPPSADLTTTTPSSPLVRSYSTSSHQQRTASPILFHPPPSPILSPINPLYHSEHTCLTMSHPPVIHPPPDLVQMTASVASYNHHQHLHHAHHHHLPSQLASIKESSPHLPPLP
jgi:hypothetical protein